MSPISFVKTPPVWVKVRCAKMPPACVLRCCLDVSGVCLCVYGAQAMSQYKATHCQAPNFAYALTVRKLKSQRAIKVEDLDLSSVRHMFNAVRLTRRVVACACVCVSVVCVCVSVSLFVCVCVCVAGTHGCLVQQLPRGMLIMLSHGRPSPSTLVPCSCSLPLSGRQGSSPRP